MLLAQLATFGMMLELFLFTSALCFYGSATMAAWSNGARRRAPRPIAWFSQQLGLLCVIFGLGLGIRHLAIMGPLLIALGYLLPVRMRSEPPPSLDVALLGTAACSLLALGGLRLGV